MLIIKFNMRKTRKIDEKLILQLKLKRRRNELS